MVQWIAESGDAAHLRLILLMVLKHNHNYKNYIII